VGDFSPCTPKSRRRYNAPVPSLHPLPMTFVVLMKGKECRKVEIIRAYIVYCRVSHLKRLQFEYSLQSERRIWQRDEMAEWGINQLQE